MRPDNTGRPGRQGTNENNMYRGRKVGTNEYGNMYDDAYDAAPAHDEIKKKNTLGRLMEDDYNRERKISRPPIAPPQPKRDPVSEYRNVTDSSKSADVYREPIRTNVNKGSDIYREPVRPSTSSGDVYRESVRPSTSKGSDIYREPSRPAPVGYGDMPGRAAASPNINMYGGGMGRPGVSGYSKPDNNKYGGQFCAPDEKVIVSLGTGYLANFLSGGVMNRVGATLTNRRLYYSGSVYFRENGRLASVKTRKIVNVRDITGTGYTFFRPLYLLGLGAIFVVCAIVAFIMGAEFEGAIGAAIGILFLVFAIMSFAAYFSKRTTLLSIEYAGGNVEFDIKWFAAHEQDNFIRNIHLVKDKLYSRVAEEQGFVNTPDQGYAAEHDMIPEL